MNQARDPCAILVNYYSVLWSDLSRSPLANLAATIVATLAFHSKVVSGALEPDGELCMKQYERLFGEVRNPGLLRDTIETFPGTRHVSVSCNGWLYSLEVVGVPASDVEASLEWIAADARKRGANPHPVGALTAGKRDNWAQAKRALLEFDERNARSFHAIESSLFHVCIDLGEAPGGDEEAGRRSLVGDATNRFFDKNFQYIAFSDSRIGFNGEHSFADAMVPVRMLTEVAPLTATILAEMHQRDKSTRRFWFWFSSFHAKRSHTCFE